MKYWFLEILKVYTVPTLLLVGTFFLLSKFTNIKDKETSQLLLGVVLGVGLGFAANLAQEGTNYLFKQQQLRKGALQLLKEDAKGIYRSMWFWERLLGSQNAPPGAKESVPPKFNFKYWDLLKQNPDFVMLCANAPFDAIFKDMSDFEQINDQIDNKDAPPVLAKAIYEVSMKEKSHEKLLRHFMTEKEIEEWNQSFIEDAKKKREQKGQ